jgi:hypothetical protein
MTMSVRVRASAIHLMLSALIAGVVAVVVLGVWYPYPYRDISGGKVLFGILVSVDVIMGPLITLAIFNPAKPVHVLKKDVAVIGLLQLLALAYGSWTLHEARPVHLVFEVDRFRVVHAVDVAPESLQQAPPALRELPMSGPTLIALRPFHDQRERSASMMEAMAGVHQATQPQYWQDYALALPAVRTVAKPVAELKSRFPNRVAELEAAIAAAGLDPVHAVYLPLVGRDRFWTALIDPQTAQPKGYLPLDPF